MLCPYLGGSTIGGFTVHNATHTAIEYYILMADIQSELIYKAIFVVCISVLPPVTLTSQLVGTHISIDRNKAPAVIGILSTRTTGHNSRYCSVII